MTTGKSRRGWQRFWVLAALMFGGCVSGIGAQARVQRAAKEPTQSPRENPAPPGEAPPQTRAQGASETPTTSTETPTTARAQSPREAPTPRSETLTAAAEQSPGETPQATPAQTPGQDRGELPKQSSTQFASDAEAKEREAAASERRKQEIELAIAVFAAVAGAFVGGVYAVRGALQGVREAEKLTREREEERANTLKEMLLSEVRCNVEALKQDQERIRQQPDSEDTWKWLAMQPCPVWSTVVWQQSVASLSHSLGKDELLNIQKFYASLASLTSARETLAEVARENRSPQLFAPPFVTRVADLTAELQRLQKALGIE